MAKYIKHYYVESENPAVALVYSNESRTGKTHPPLKGLDVKVWCGEPNDVDYCLSVIPDTTSVPPIPGIQELTLEQWKTEAENFYNALKTHQLSLTQDQTVIDHINAATFDGTDVDSIVASFGLMLPSPDPVS